MHVEGVLIKSPVMGQSVELVAKSINVIGPCDGQVNALSHFHCSCLSMDPSLDGLMYEGGFVIDSWLWR